VLAVLVSAAIPAVAAPATTESRTIRDADGDDRLEYAAGECHVVLGGAARPRTSILNFVQLTDLQIVDEESPGRVSSSTPPRATGKRWGSGRTGT
jgi:hypothetical protein